MEVLDFPFLSRAPLFPSFTFKPIWSGLEVSQTVELIAYWVILQDELAFLGTFSRLKTLDFLCSYYPFAHL